MTSCNLAHHNCAVSLQQILQKLVACFEPKKLRVNFCTCGPTAHFLLFLHLTKLEKVLKYLNAGESICKPLLMCLNRFT